MSQNEEGNSMRQKKILFLARVILAILTLTLALPMVAARTYKIIHSFKRLKSPEGNLTLDAAGNLYGTTEYGGDSSCKGSAGRTCGVVYKLAPNSDGTWTVSILHVFEGADGLGPRAGLVLDAAGNLYGTTDLGGGSSGCDPFFHGCGAVFKLAPNGDGTWTESVLHGFSSVGGDGANPDAALILDAAGNLYGTAYGGGDYANGIVFKLALNSDGTWTFSTLYSFTGRADGSGPEASLTFDETGNLYGTTRYGGANDQGVAFKLAPNHDGTWTESVLHSFTSGADGGQPFGGLVLDATGSLYGTTPAGGASDHGVVFKLAPNRDGTWTESVLHSFNGADGSGPYGGLIFDAAGNLHGTTFSGGAVNDGVVFKMTKSNGGWAFHVLHTFQGKPGANPDAGVIVDKAGNLYGTTGGCGTGYDCHGAVFEITP
jgi:uncharacterized repeat protein (TIGR03803 family)